MKTVFVPVALAASLLTAAPRAHALWVDGQMIPGHTQSGNSVIQVTASDVDGQKEFVVTVAPTSGKLSPFTDGDLTLVTDAPHADKIPVAGIWKARTVSFRFRVPAPSLAHSRFDVRQQNYGVYTDERGKPRTDALGRPKVERFLGGQAFWFFLGDFTGGPKK